MNELNDITEKIINACINIHRNLGPGLLESTYQQCLALLINFKVKLLKDGIRRYAN